MLKDSIVVSLFATNTVEYLSENSVENREHTGQPRMILDQFNA